MVLPLKFMYYSEIATQFDCREQHMAKLNRTKSLGTVQQIAVYLKYFLLKIFSWPTQGANKKILGLLDIA